MLAAGCLPPPSAPPQLVVHKPSTPLSLLSFHQSHNSKFPILLPLMILSNYSSLSISGRSGFCLFAKKKEKNQTLENVEEDDDEFDFDETEYFDDDDDDEEFDEEFDDDDDEGMLPYHKMNAFLEKKPKGFGEGKVYDTSVEDELLLELQQSIAQFDKLKKLKKEPGKPKPNNELQEVFKGVPGGIRVRLNSLPKKRKIYRDLKSAFEGVPGIINILPVNSGNKKTRDPVCKGVAFVDFKSLADANSFVQMFSGKSIAFGKSEKAIKCEILKPLDASDEGSSYGYNSTSEGSLTVLEEDEDEDVDDDDDDDDDFEQSDTELQSGGADDFDELVKGLDGKFALKDVEKSDNIDRIEMLEAKLLARAAFYEDELKSKKKSSEVNDKPDKKPKQKPSKKANLKPEKKPKLSIPGSAKKLKVREKAKLADVYSRYGKRQASASKEM